MTPVQPKVSSLLCPQCLQNSPVLPPMNLQIPAQDWDGEGAACRYEYSVRNEVIRTVLDHFNLDSATLLDFGSLGFCLVFFSFEHLSFF